MKGIFNIFNVYTYMQYIEFKKAKSIIHNLKIKSVKEYYSLFKEGKIPAGIPRNPNRDYVEFINWPDFLGNGNVAAKDKPFLSYEDCREYLLHEGVDSKDKFEAWRKLKLNNLVPTKPDKTYKTEWKSWGVFFKTSRVADIIKHQNFLNYSEAKEYLAKFNFANEEEFYLWAKSSERPNNIPASPRKTYGKDFVSMGDFLGNGNYHFKKYLPFNECIEFIHSLKLNSIMDFQKWITENKKTHSIPSHPQDIYPEFEGWPEFLGYQRNVSVGEKTISSILVSNGIKHVHQYTFADCVDLKPLPFDIAITDEFNKVKLLIEFHGIQHFESIEFYGGIEALEKTQKRDKIKKDYCKKNNIPLIEIIYKHNLEIELVNSLAYYGIAVDLTLERKSAINRNYLSFEEAKTIIRELKLTSVIDFNKLKDKRPLGVPSQPNLIYKKNGWISWGDFLGTNRVQSKKATFVSYEECKKWMLDNEIKSAEEWRIKRINKPSYIPSHPEKIYKSEWKGWQELFNPADTQSV
jgi:hypothetical protein